MHKHLITGLKFFANYVESIWKRSGKTRSLKWCFVLLPFVSGAQGIAILAGAQAPDAPEHARKITRVGDADPRRCLVTGQIMFPDQVLGVLEAGRVEFELESAALLPQLPEQRSLGHVE